jgi:hypothetical protein
VTEQLNKVSKLFENLEFELKNEKDISQRLNETLAKNMKDFETQVSLRVETEKKLGQLL